MTNTNLEANRDKTNGQFGTSQTPENPGTSITAAPDSAADVALLQAYTQLQEAEKVIASVTTHNIARRILEVRPDAAYLDLDDDEDGRYGHKISAAELYDGAEPPVRIADRLDEIDDYEGTQLESEVEDMLSEVETFHQIDSSPAVKVELVSYVNGVGRRERHRIDLRAALALYPTES